MMMLSLAKRVGRGALRRLRALQRMDPTTAFDLWSASYDGENTNALHFLDDRAVTRLLAEVPLRDRVVADVGCGTGRHWPRFLAERPARLVGYDVSLGMLLRLRDKHPQAAFQLLSGYRLPMTPDRSCDVVVSTLTLGYLRDLDAAFAAWSRVLRPGGDVIVTDFHPALARGGDRGFRHEGREISIRHVAHPLAAIEAAAARHGLTLLRRDEHPLDASVRSLYEADGALPLFDKLAGRPLLYGLHFRFLSRPTHEAE